jgi:hypothetical protein
MGTLEGERRTGRGVTGPEPPEPPEPPGPPDQAGRVAQ